MMWPRRNSRKTAIIVEPEPNIYVSSRKAGERVLESLTDWLGKRLKLKVNVEKSAVDRPWNRSFLGYSLTN